MNWLRLFVLLLEWGVQLKRRDDEAKRKKRLSLAQNNPGDYLRQFGRVQRASEQEDSMCGNYTSVEECKRK